MKITSVQATAIAVRTGLPTDAATGIWDAVPQVFVEIGTEDGLTGLGEAFAYGMPNAVAAVINETLAPRLQGQDATQTSALTERLFRSTHLFGRYGITTFAISGVEMALWDLAGKRANMPLWQLLGGAAELEVPAYASLIRHPEHSSIISDESLRAVDEGYTMVKLHQNEPASVAMARTAIGSDVPLTVDINCEWSPYDATAMACALDEHELLWLEEPVWPPEDFEGLARVRVESGVAIAAGENYCTLRQFQAAFDAGALTFAQPSVTKVGGIAEFLRVAELAALQGIELAPHSPYFGPGFVATLHLIAHIGHVEWVEKIYVDLEAPLFAEPLAFSDGVYKVPDGPGLGVALAPDLLTRYRI